MSRDRYSARTRYDIRDPRQLEVLTSPVRHQLHQVLDLIGPAPVREVAARMGRSPEALYYHVHAMVEVGLVVEAGEQTARRRSERLYDVVGRPFRVDPTNTDPAFLALLAKAGEARLRLAIRAGRDAMRDPDANREGDARDWRLEQQQVRLSADARAELNRRITDIIWFLREADDPDGEPTLVTMATARIPSSGDGSGS